jgi:mRNA interferase MazF
MATSTTASSRRPRRGEIWWVDFNPTKGSEIQKTRPAVVVSSDGMGALPVKLVVPITGWKDAFALNPWHVRVKPDTRNGLDKVSAVDVLQTRGVDILRFRDRIGRLTGHLSCAFNALVCAKRYVHCSETACRQAATMSKSLGL